MTTVGFTGTRQVERVSAERITRLADELRSMSGSEFHHGDCVGMDAIAARIAANYDYRLISHPCDIDSARAYVPAHEELPELPPLIRNRDIVDAATILIAVPKDPLREERRSGTWSTIRYARTVGIPVIII